MEEQNNTVPNILVSIAQIAVVGSTRIVGLQWA